MNPEDLAKLAMEILNHLETGELVGYLSSLFLLGCWYFHVRSMRKSFSREYERIGKEKSDIQRIAAKINFESSGK
jgi:hypothetical protein